MKHKMSVMSGGTSFLNTSHHTIQSSNRKVRIPQKDIEPMNFTLDLSFSKEESFPF